MSVNQMTGAANNPAVLLDVLTCTEKGKQAVASGTVTPRIRQFLILLQSESNQVTKRALGQLLAKVNLEELLDIGLVDVQQSKDPIAELDLRLQEQRQSTASQPQSRQQAQAGQQAQPQVQASAEDSAEAIKAQLVSETSLERAAQESLSAQKATASQTQKAPAALDDAGWLEALQADHAHTGQVDMAQTINQLRQKVSKLKGEYAPDPDPALQLVAGSYT